MKHELHVFNTVAKPQGSSVYRSGFVRLSFPSYDDREAPVVATVEGTSYRLVDGHLYQPLPNDRQISSTPQIMVNRMLAPHVTPDQASDLSSRTGGEPGAGSDLTETERGEILRATAATYAIIGGRFHIPSPGPLVQVSVGKASPLGTPAPDQNAVVTKVEWTSAGHFLSDRGALFTLDRVEEALDFARGVTSAGGDMVPTLGDLVSRAPFLDISLDGYDFPDLAAMQLWFDAHSSLFTAIYTPIHDFGREGVAATMALRRNLGDRCGGRDPFLETIFAHGYKREFGAFARPYDVAGLEMTYGPLLDCLVTLAEREGHPLKTFNALLHRRFLEWSVPSYRPPERHGLDDEDLSALDDVIVEGPKP